MYNTPITQCHIAYQNHAHGAHWRTQAYTHSHTLSLSLSFSLSLSHSNTQTFPSTLPKCIGGLILISGSICLCIYRDRQWAFHAEISTEQLGKVSWLILVVVVLVSGEHDAFLVYPQSPGRGRGQRLCLSIYNSGEGLSAPSEAQAPLGSEWESEKQMESAERGRESEMELDRDREALFFFESWNCYRWL